MLWGPQRGPKPAAACGCGSGWASAWAEVCPRECASWSVGSLGGCRAEAACADVALLGEPTSDARVATLNLCLCGQSEGENPTAKTGCKQDKKKKTPIKNSL